MPLETKLEKLNFINEAVKKCTKCNEICNFRTQTVFGAGDVNSKVVFLGEAPGKEEDAYGEPFVGRAGKLLNGILDTIGVTRDSIYVCNCLKCRPPLNRKPEPEELKNCGNYLMAQLSVVSPKLIVCFGSTASQYLLQTKDTISLLRGKWYTFNNDYVSAIVLCTWHPSYALRMKNQVEQQLYEDLKLVFDRLKNLENAKVR